VDVDLVGGDDDGGDVGVARRLVLGRRDGGNQQKCGCEMKHLHGSLLSFSIDASTAATTRSQRGAWKAKTSAAARPARARRRFWSRFLARWSRTFTAGSEMPSASPTSSVLMPSISRSTNTAR